MNETQYQSKLIKKIERRLPDSMVLKNNPEHIQGIPDLLVLNSHRWGMLEVKVSADAETQPNQPYYVDLLNEMSFSAFIYPENEKEVLDALQLALSD